jgi:predicted DNA-binding transcriptional regulator YafY
MRLTRPERCFRLHAILKSGVRFSINELANILQVSSRTVFRDLAVVQKATDHSLHSLGSAQTPFSTTETIALALSAKLSPLQTMSEFSGPLNSGLAKLILNSPGKIRSGLAQMVSGCSMIGVATIPTAPWATLQEILKAISQGQVIRVEYNNATTQTVERTNLAQQRLQVSPNGWHLSGQSSAHHKRVEIELSTITSVKPLKK